MSVKSLLVMMAFAGSSCNCGVVVFALTTTAAASSNIKMNSMWQRLDAPQPQSWKTVFGEMGERGEYMDGYPRQSMIERCKEDYKWESTETVVASERAKMMSYLYNDKRLWEHISMVAFAQHYVLTDHCEEASSLRKPFDTFQKQKDSQALGENQIFSGVVWTDWQLCHENGTMEQELAAFEGKGIDYVRLECNFGSVDDIGSPTQLTDSPVLSARFSRLAEATKACQKQEMVPLVLIQVPWREAEESHEYFEQAMKSFAGTLKDVSAESKRMLLETRPPIGVSAREEKALTETDRLSLGLETGQRMFEVIEKAFDGDKIAGFCIAGGSTKGDVPTAMEDDTQNAVRQGMRRCAKRHWDYDVCFWEMGAKLMLQPKVGQLWANDQGGRDAASELFCINAKGLADEIKVDLLSSR